jgi:chorismate synthase
MLRYLTSGESHGPALLGILEGMPAGLAISADYINEQLRRRQGGYGRGGRMKIETDTVQILGGVRHGKTLGSPVGLMIENRDWKNWTTKMSIEAVDDEVKQVQIPRPGHADFAGAIKYRHRDIRNVLERSSARETAIRVALGGVSLQLLEEFGIRINSHVVRIGSAAADIDPETVEWDTINEQVDDSPLRCLDKQAEEAMVKLIDEAKEKGDSLGGVCEIVATHLPIGLGSHVHWDRRLEAAISQAMMAIPAIKAVEIGMGMQVAELFGSQVHDPIEPAPDRAETPGGPYRRSRNNAGGIEGGMTNGEPLVVRIAMKPISTLIKPLPSVNLYSGDAAKAHIERTDTCAVPAAAIVGEAILALTLADAFLEKFGNDSVDEIRERQQTAIRFTQS